MASACTTSFTGFIFHYLVSVSSSRASNGVVKFQPFCSTNMLCLRSTHPMFGFIPILQHRLHPHAPFPRDNDRSIVVNAKRKKSKRYKMKTHNASAARFKVTGRGKLMRRQAGVRSLSSKSKNRRRRLKKMVPVALCDYRRIIRCMPYAKIKKTAVQFKRKKLILNPPLEKSNLEESKAP